MGSLSSCYENDLIGFRREGEQAVVAEQEEKHFGLGLITVQWEELRCTSSNRTAM